MYKICRGDKYYHIQYKKPFFEIGSELFVGNSPTPYHNHIHKNMFSKSFYLPDKANITGLNEIMKLLEKVDTNICKGYRDFLMYSKEHILENVRITHFPHLPSRFRSLFVIPSDKYCITYWFNKFQGEKRIFEVSLTGKLFLTDAKYLDIKRDNINPQTLYEDAFKYWLGINDNQYSQSTELLFEGIVKIVKEINID